MYAEAMSSAERRQPASEMERSGIERALRRKGKPSASIREI